MVRQCPEESEEAEADLFADLAARPDWNGKGPMRASGSVNGEEYDADE